MSAIEMALVAPEVEVVAKATRRRFTAGAHRGDPVKVVRVAANGLVGRCQGSGERRVRAHPWPAGRGRPVNVVERDDFGSGNVVGRAFPCQRDPAAGIIWDVDSLEAAGGGRGLDVRVGNRRRRVLGEGRCVKHAQRQCRHHEEDPTYPNTQPLQGL